MTVRYAAVVNVHSRRIRKDPAFLPSLREAFGNRGPFLEPGSPGELPPAMADVRRSGADVLFVCGGDGTLRQTVGAMIRTYEAAPFPRIAVLKTGTMNTVAGGIGIRRSALPQLRFILERCDRGLPIRSVPIHPLSIDESFGFIFAVGGFSNFIRRYAEAPDPSPARAFRMLTRTTLSSLLGTSYARSLFPPFPARVSKDGTTILDRVPVTTLSASAIRHIGFGFKPYAQAEGPAGDFGVLILHDSPRILVPHLWRLRRGTPIHGSLLRQFSAAEIRIEVDSELAPMVDGDILEPRKEFALRRGPALDFMTG
jgi:diacylglycerol kinase family enzyme